MTYRSDKNTVQDLFLPINLLVIAKEGLSKPVFYDFVMDAIKKYLVHFKKTDQADKLLWRTEKLCASVMNVLEDRRTIHGHKYILTLHALAEMLVIDNEIVRTMIEDLFVPFLEAEENTEMPADEWRLVKESAEKQARKIHAKLVGLGYFNNN